jgi:hypothetical protein
MLKTAEVRYRVAPNTVETEQLANDFEVSFTGEGELFRDYFDRPGSDCVRQKYAGEVGINPGLDPETSTPIFWIETSRPREEKMAREATLADAISFSENDLLQRLISTNVSKLLKRDEYGRH